MYNYDNPRYRAKVWDNIKWGAILAVVLWMLALATGKAQDSTVVIHEVIAQSSPGSFTNYNFLIKGLSRNPDEIKRVANSLVAKYCSDKVCNQLYFWRNDKAYHRLMDKQETITLDNYGYDKAKWLKAEAKWKGKHWTFVCENLAAIYNGYETSELEYDPFFDTEYRKYGGKLKRAKSGVETLSIVKATPESGKQDSSGDGMALLVATGLIVWAIWYARRLKRKKANAPT